MSMSKQVADIAREKHDFFNLVALLPLIIVNFYNWQVDKVIQGHFPGDAWTGQYFWELWGVTALYFLADLVWVVRVPICVKSPGVIIKHHVFAIAYMSAPIVYSEHRWFLGACLTVEANTWFLILRRVVYKRHTYVPEFVQKLVDALFYTTWIVVRLFIYPAILAIFLSMAVQAVKDTGIYWHNAMMFIPVHAFLCLLNLKWSYDLFQPIVAKWIMSPRERAAAAAAGRSSVSSGL